MAIASPAIGAPWDVLQVKPCPVDLLKPAMRNQLFDMLATIAWGDVLSVKKRSAAAAADLPPTPTFDRTPVLVESTPALAPVYVDSTPPPTPSFDPQQTQAVMVEAPQTTATSSSWPSSSQESPTSWPTASQDAPDWGSAMPESSGGWGQADMGDWGTSQWPEEKKERKSRRSTGRRTSDNLPEFGGEGGDGGDQAWQAQAPAPRKKEKKEKARPVDGRSLEEKLAEQMAAAQAKMGSGFSQAKDKASEASKKMSDRLQQGQENVAQNAANSYAKKASGGLISEVPPGVTKEALGFAKKNSKEASRLGRMFGR